uniref:Protein kinase domain-containing protein n=1 Tax=Panagrolaimus davidi TaxID=227884 RepID=A0A914PH90_9BILA
MIHRDVACRNILLLNSNIAKLADFGLCCYCDKNGIFKDTMQKKFPVKWLSIEALRQGLFSDKSDVWAFGVLCFEVFSYGEIPYSMIEYPKMLEILKEGTRLEKPKDAPTYLYELMQDCWEEDTDKRPTFKEINRKIKLMLEQESVKYGYVILS